MVQISSSFCSLRPCVSCLTAKDNTCLCFPTLYCLSFRTGSDSSPHHCRWFWRPPNRWPNKVREQRRQPCLCLFISVQLFSKNSRLSDLCHNLSAHSHSVRLSFTFLGSQVGHAAAAAEALRLLFPAALRSAHRPPGLVFLGCRLFASCFISPFPSSAPSSLASCPFNCLYIFSSSNHFPLSPNLLCSLTWVLKDGSTHICAAKSCRSAGTYCSCKRCQPASIVFMNHFLSTFFLFFFSTCGVAASLLVFSLFSWGY